ncbi:MAG: hypothetical protein JW716_02270 [Candidatus Aenigmarchaeota archaeon]|nr:hypothetical protein [Candidatus Aenigmarchaeota archaeon]
MESEIRKKVCIFDVDYFTVEKKTSIRLWGVTYSGEAITIIDDTFRPYFYVEPASDWKSKQRTGEIIQMIKELNELGHGCINKVEIVTKKFLGEEKEFIKITLNQPPDVIWLWDIIKKWPSIKSQYEYDIPFRKRYVIDREIPIMEWIVITGEKTEIGDVRSDLCIRFVSMEKTNDNDVLPEPETIAVKFENIEGKIAMISVVGKGGYRKVLTHGTEILKSEEFSVDVMDTEKDLIERFVSIIHERKPQIILTYNGDKVDFRILDERADILKIQMAIGCDNRGLSFYLKNKYEAAIMCGIAHIDLYNFITNIVGRNVPFETTGLDDVSKKFLGEGRDDLERRDIEILWKKKEDVIRIMKHNIKDAELIFRLSDHIMPQIFQFSNICRQTIFDVSRMRPSQMINWILVRESVRLNEIILNQPTPTEINRRFSVEPYEGGYSMEPQKGIYKNIAVLEFANLYPSIVLEHNISPEMVDIDAEMYEKYNKVPESEHFFSRKKRGFVPSVVLHSMEEGKKTLELMKEVPEEDRLYVQLNSRQEALKLLANSVYGYFAYPGSRWYSRICAYSVASWGRQYMKNALDITTKEEGYEIIFADSYSFFIPETSEKRMKELIDKIKEKAPKNSELILKDVYKSGILTPGSTKTTQRRYALLDSGDHLTIKGFEAVRRDWSRIAKETQEMVLMSILRDRSPKKAEEIVKSAIERIKSGDVDMEDLVIRNQMTKPIEKYDQNWPHVSAAKKLSVRGGIVAVGSIISYIVASGPGTVSERAEPYGYTENYDAEYYINKQILGAVSKIMETADFSMTGIEEAAEENKDQESLNKFFRKSFAERLKEKLGV